MSDQRQENKTQIVDSENVPSESSINAEFKESDYSEVEKERQKMRLGCNEEKFTGDEMRVDLKMPKEDTEVDLKPSPEVEHRALPEAEKHSVESEKQSTEEEKQSSVPEMEKQSAETESQSAVPEAEKQIAPPEKQSVLPETQRQSVALKAEKQSVLQEREKQSAAPEKQSLLPETERQSAALEKPSVLEKQSPVLEAEKPSPVQERPSAVPKVETVRPMDEMPRPKVEIQSPKPMLEKLWTGGGAAVLVLAIAIGVGVYIHQFCGTQTSNSRSALQIFQDEFKRLQEDFPEQSQNLWLRSGKMMTNHLNKSHPDEPATIILTAAQDAKHTLLCLASGLAQTYAFALNSSWLVIHGPSQAKYDDSTAKLNIDEKLSSGFESRHRAAVLNHLETLPPGSLLILYKYCDHENAAYKKVALVFTILLEDSSLEPDTPLPELEEKVRDFLWKQFIHSGTSRSHQEMDSDKLGGVWSRISHLVLPVFPVERIEAGNCPFDLE